MVDRILLLGYFGAGNFGDDALLVNWLSSRRGWLESRRITVDITTRQLDPLAGFTEGGELRALTGDYIDKRDALKVPPDKYYALLAPGGSLIQDVTSLKSALYYLAMVRRFVKAGRPVFLLNQGIGPLNSWLASFLTPRYLANVTMLSVRDGESHHWALRQPPLKRHPNLLHTADPMLAGQLKTVDPPGDLPDEYILVIPKQTHDLPHPGDATTEPDALAALIGHSWRTNRLPHVLLPMHLGQDTAFCEAVADASDGRASAYDPGEAAYRDTLVHSVIAGARLVISYRLHGLVTAAAHGIPAMGVAYDPKVSAFATEMGFPYCFPATVHEETALTDLARLWNSYDDVRDYALREREQSLERLSSAEDRFDQLWND